MELIDKSGATTKFPFTNPSKFISTQRNCGWCFTLHKFTVDDEEALKLCECKFVIYGKEVTGNGSFHLQGYIYFHNPGKTFYAVKRILPSAYWTQSKGCMQANIDYCSKQGNVFNKGNLKRYML